MKIGRLTKLDPRKLWENEANHFTPWLAEEENISILGEEIGLDLEVMSEEKNVGPFRADILCKNTLDDTYVLIENQLERTDHTHLGQLLTYAAGLEAVTIVWIAKRFTEEHRAAIDWLNRVTDEKLRFFGIEIEVYQIGDSIPAPKFEVVAKPNDWSKAVQKGTRPDFGKLTEAKAIYLDYWTAMKAYFEKSSTKLRHQKPQPQHWMNFAIGKSGFVLAATSSVRDGVIRVQLYIQTENSTNTLLQLQSKYQALSQQEIDQNIEWLPMEDKLASIVVVSKEADVNERSDWPNQHKWILENLEKMDAFFRPKIKSLG